ncbi:MAG: winged helix-turn-helix domain-containing protein [Anaerolineae bacterium]
MEIITATALDNLKRSPTPQPLYLQVVAQIQELIKQGELAPGDQLLSERELAEKLGVSRTSVRKAVAKLEGMGVIAVTPRDGA